MRAAGFTLLELVVALAIATLLFAMVMPAGGTRHERAELAASARAVAASLQATRSRAILWARPTSFTIDVDHALYQAPGAAPRALPPGTRLALIADQEQVLGDAVASIRFYPDGSSSGGSLTLSRGGERYAVAVDWLTGGTSIHAEPQAAPR